MSKPAILIVNPGPFGKLTDIYEYCQELKDEYSVTYYGFREDEHPIPMPGINMLHEFGHFKGIANRVKYIANVYRLINRNQYSKVWVIYFKGVSALLFKRTAINIDIRTGSVLQSSTINRINNMIMRFETSAFKNVSIISELLRLHLNIQRMAKVVPLGGRDYLQAPKVYNSFGINMIYVGTFFGRDIESTIKGFAGFLNSCHNPERHSYTIIGYGNAKDIDSINEEIEKYKMQKAIQYLGKIPYPFIDKFYLSHNIGLSYIPTEIKYEFQPPTKTREYLMNNLFVIGTSTAANKELINKNNGIIIEADAQSLELGLLRVNEQLENIDFVNIRINSNIHTWSEVVKKYVKPLLLN